MCIRDRDEIATHGDYKHLCQRWEGLTVHTAKQFAKEMRENPEFEQYVFNPTHKLVFIDYEAVSYTHLDVYKRQVFNNTISVKGGLL